MRIRGDRISPLLLLALLMGGHLAWVLSRFQPAYSSPDGNGYFLQGRLLAQEGRTWLEPESPVQYVGVHWLVTPGGKFFSRYPPGFPLLIAAAYKAGGPTAALLVNPLLATLTLLFLFLLCRPWIGPWPALLASFLFALNPVAARHALHADSHTSATAFLVLGLWLLDRWARAPSPWKGAAAGLVLGFLPAIRYAESVAALGVWAFLFLACRRERKVPRGLGWLLLGAALPVGALLVRNRLAFGSFLHTGYSLTGEQEGFGLDFFARHWLPYVESLLATGGGPFFALGLAGLAGMAAREKTRPMAFLLGGVVVPITLVYMAYYWGAGESALRFFLPTLPLYFLPGLWLLLQVSPRKAGVLALGAAALLQAGTAFPAARASLALEGRNGAVPARVEAWLESHLPGGSVIVADRRLQESLDFFGLWKLADKEILLGPGPGRGRRPPGGSPGRPSPLQREKLEVRRRFYSDLDPGERALAAAADLLAWAGKERGVYWVGRREEVDAFARGLEGGVEVEPLGKIELPPLPGGPISRPGRGGRRRVRPFRPLPGPGGGRPGRPRPGGPLQVFRLRF